MTENVELPSNKTADIGVAALGADEVTQRLRDIQSPEPLQTIILCTDERTGSHHLAELLASTGQLGRPYEYSNTPWMKDHYADYPESVVDQLVWAKRLGTTPNGVFSLKLHPWAMDRIAPFIDICHDLPSPVFVALRRRDLLAQAISYQKAWTTQMWTSRSEKRADPEYDGPRIRQLLNELAVRRERWEIYFACNGITPLHLDYETLLSNPEGAVLQVAQHAGLPDKPSLGQSTWYEFKQQGDETNVIWRKRFLKEYAETRYLAPLPSADVSR